MADRETILERVQKLLAKADSTTFDAERDALIAKADELMIAYAIESFELDKLREAKDRVEKVVIRKIMWGRTPLGSQLVELASAAASHARCRVVIYGNAPARGVGVVGFESDTEYVEMLFTHLWMQLSSKLEPRPDPELSVEENIIMLLDNGQSRKRVCELLGIDYQKNHLNISKIWKHHVEALGQEYQPRSRTHPTTYARNFAGAFASEVSIRLWKIREARGEETTGNALALRDRSEEVKEAFEEMFPKLGTYRDSTQAMYDASAQRRGRKAGAEADLHQTKIGNRRPALSGEEG